jgi:hypothetical protein
VLKLELGKKKIIQETHKSISIFSKKLSTKQIAQAFPRLFDLLSDHKTDLIL